jgi:chromosome segregation ATPase
MKQYLSIILTVVCLVLVIALFLMKHSDDAQHDSETSSITDFSNQLDLAQMHLSICNGTALIFSNNLNDSQSALLTFSNQLTQAGSVAALDGEQITNLNQQVMDVKSENQTLAQHLVDLTGQTSNQLAGLTRQLTTTQASLAETNKDFAQLGKDYVLLENRFRMDVAERLVVERKFNNFQALQAQLRNVKSKPPGVISAQSIYAGLNVEVRSNGTVHVLTPE